MTVIDVEGLTKTFGRVCALDRLNLSVEAGQVCGFLGPNGAGKSTTIRVLLGLLRADSGRVRLFQADPWKQAVSVHRRLAYVPGDVPLWPGLTGGEIVDYLNRLHGRGTRTRARELCERFDLDPTKKARTYSKGNRQKVALVAALARDADLYIFDEPTSGLDPLMEAVFTDCIRSLAEQGRTILLSSHILSEVEKVCDTVTIIRDGRAVESGSLAELRHLTRSRVTTVVDPERADAIAELPTVHDLVRDEADGGTRLVFDIEDSSVADVAAAVSQAGVRSLQVAPPSLEELFMRHYGTREDADESCAVEGMRR